MKRITGLIGLGAWLVSAIAIGAEPVGGAVQQRSLNYE